MEADTLEHFRRRVSLSCAPAGTSVVKAKERDAGPHAEQPEEAGTTQKGSGEGNHHRRDTSLAIKFDINLDKASLLNRMKFQRRFVHMCIKETSHSLSLSLALFCFSWMEECEEQQRRVGARTQLTGHELM